LQLVRIFSLQEESSKQRSNIIDDTLRHVSKITFQYKEMQQHLESLQIWIGRVSVSISFLVVPGLIYTGNQVFPAEYWLFIPLQNIFVFMVHLLRYFRYVWMIFQYVETFLYYSICWGAYYSLQAAFWTIYTKMIADITSYIVQKGYATKLEARRLKMTLLAAKRDEIHARCKLLVDHINEKLSILSEREQRLRRSISSHLASRSISINIVSSRNKTCTIM